MLTPMLEHPVFCFGLVLIWIRSIQLHCHTHRLNPDESPRRVLGRARCWDCWCQSLQKSAGWATVQDIPSLLNRESGER